MLETLLWILFVAACIVVSFVILLQEGKGGGLGEAFGGAGQQTFGVKAEGINKFTGLVSLVVVVIAIVITKLCSDSSMLSFSEPTPLQGVPAEQSAPAEPGTPAPAAPAGEAPAQPASQPPAGGGGGK
jgi:preprotein translocase subunit SecG